MTLPAQAEDRINSGEFQTHLYWPGIDLRFEHADPERRSASTRMGHARSSNAKPVSEFGNCTTRSNSHVGARLLCGFARTLATIDLMGFDTNDPHGTRTGPNMHMILWWPTVKGTGSLVGPLLSSVHAAFLRILLLVPSGAMVYQAEFPIGSTFLPIPDINE